jgi:ammonium transporter, Amt family
MSKRSTIFLSILLVFLILLGSATVALAQTSPTDVNTLIKELTAKVEAAQALGLKAEVKADTAFILICSALVLLMTPGLAFFYGGLVKSRNVINTMMMSLIVMAIVGVTWILWGYSLAFAPGLPFIGGLQWAFGNVGSEIAGYLPFMPYEESLKAADPQYVELSSYAATIPHQTFMIYQAMFAIITPALISGAIAERISFKAFCLFMLFWSTFVYNAIAHMVWAKGGFVGLYGGTGALDFAGGTVVHVSAGVSALVAALFIGPRRSFPDQFTPPHNIPFVLLGVSLLWFGWFGFNAGSALSSGALATTAFIATNTSTAMAALTWVILESVLRGKPTSVGFATGALAGLVGITPAAGFVTPLSAIFIGSITSVACFVAINLKFKLKIDDSLDAFPVHGVGGAVGSLLTGIFTTKMVNPNGANGLLFGDKGQLFVGNNPQQVLFQLTDIGITIIVAGVGTFVILWVLDALVGLRVKPQIEDQGLDIDLHGEEAYGHNL